ncbi:hypothetical protein ABT273_31010, partial [Streptomyces humidus]|uniref:hypothetical protein n=1 Tax=Streptomyces humidus TaxID=52259 RepID=UPI00332EA2C0
WTAPKAEEWDRQTFETWLRANAVIPSAKFLRPRGALRAADGPQAACGGLRRPGSPRGAIRAAGTA